MRASAVARSPQKTVPDGNGTSESAVNPAGAAHAVNGTAHAAANGVTRGVARDGGETIEQCLLRSLDQYFRDLGGARPHQLHDMVMQAVERPLMKFALERASGNQSAAAELLGINRNTLRKKLIEHGLAEAPAKTARAPVKRAATRARSATARKKR